VGQSTLVQRVSLGARSRRLDFATDVEWKERRKMLRVSFAVGIVSETASFDIQFGSVERPTHRNTSWDAAKFEVAGHRFADLSEGSYGVALLNDCKYGYKVYGNRLDLSLLRSPVQPDPDADLGSHRFTYSLLPHPGSLVDSAVFAEAAKLNQGISVFDGFDGTHFRFPVRLEGRGIVLEALKKAEKEECLVVRAYETRGCSSEARLQVPDGMVVQETGIMEWDERPVESRNGRVTLAFRPFEIRTFKLMAVR
jgi:alpha-mannosidase